MEMQLVFVKLLAVVVLLGANAFFVAVEFAVVSVPPTRVDQLVAKGNPLARLAQMLLSDTNRVLAGAQVGITMASLGIGWLGEETVAGLFEALGAGIPVDRFLIRTTSFTIAFILITATHIVIGEQVPKMAAITHPTSALLLSAQPMRFFGALMRPFVFALDRATEAVLALFRIEPAGQHKIVYTTDELKQLVTESHDRGEIESVEREIIHHAFEFAGRTLEEVMIPRTAMVALEDTAAIADFMKLFAESGHTRLPIYTENLDNIIGFVWIKDVMRALVQDPQARQQNAKSIARSAVFVPGSKSVGALFTEMRHDKTQLAIVIDEYGGTAGMVTVEEIIEELVGRIGGELTAVQMPWRKVDATTAEADANLRIGEVNEQLGITLPEAENYETIAGLILEQLRKIPQPGESVTVGDVKLTVLQMKGPKIERVRIAWMPPTRT